MPEDAQTSTNNPTDQTDPSATNTGVDAGSELDMEGIDPNLKIPSLEDIEYATPSAYIDPDLPANPTPIEDPNEPQEEEPEEEPETIEMTPEQIAEAVKASNEIMASVAEKIANARNIVVALSSDPSVDELSAAISLSLFLDRLGKHAIAVYSGATPSALQFLKPEDIFEKNADVMQDFVISLSKEKADHLRYKLEDDSVKIFITPYKDRIASEDLNFSYGDYNIDLVLSLNVNNGVDLDPALREYGTIMHDASVVNITAGNPGKFGEIEWSNKFSSSVSEMVSNLLLSAEGDTKIDAEEATALLTGIVAATDRFSRANTASSTMQTASRLMDAGADQQLVAANISDDLDNQFFAFSDSPVKKDADANAAANSVEDVSISFKPTEEKEPEIPDDDTALKISHQEDEDSTEFAKDFSEESSDKTAEEAKEDEKSDSSSSFDLSGSSNSSDSEVEESKTEDSKSEGSNEDKNLNSVETPELAKSEETTSAESESDKPEDTTLLDELKATEASLSTAGAETVKEPEQTPQDLATAVAATETAIAGASAPEATTSMSAPAAPATPSTPPVEEFADATSKYSQMLTDALNGPAASPEPSNMTSALPPVANPAATNAPAVSTTEVNGVPEINYGQTTGDILPPPPAPPVDVNSPMPVPAPSSLPPVTTEPAPSVPADASAFTIPGM